jgi:hypothetical protein
MPGITDDAAQERFSAVRDTSERINVVYMSEANRIVHYRKDAGYDGSWQEISTDVGARDVGRLGITAGAGGGLYLFYEATTGATPYPAGNNVLYYRYFDGTVWGNEIGPYNTSNLNESLGLMELAYDCTIGIGYSRSASSPYSLRILVPNGLYSVNCFTFNTSVSGTQIRVGTYNGLRFGIRRRGRGRQLALRTSSEQCTTTRAGGCKYNLFSTWVDGERPGALRGLRLGRWEQAEASWFSKRPARTKLQQNYTYVSEPHHFGEDWSVTYPNWPSTRRLHSAAANEEPMAYSARVSSTPALRQPPSSATATWILATVVMGGRDACVLDLAAFPPALLRRPLRAKHSTWEHVYAAADTRLRTARSGDRVHGLRPGALPPTISFPFRVVSGQRAQ